MIPNTNDASLAILLGQPNTYKGRLSRAFLAGAFVLDGDCIDEHKSGFAVLLTTQVLDKKTLVDKLLAHIGISLEHPQRDSAQRIVEARTLCRRLAARHLSSADLLEAIERHVFFAQSCLALQHSKPADRRILEAPWYLPGDGFDFLNHAADGSSPSLRSEYGPLVRVVIDDWSAIISAHRLIARDPYLLQSLTAILKRERVNALIVSTQDVIARGSVPLGDVAGPNELHRLDELQLLTWAVPFFGERRIALGVQLPATERSVPRIFELRPHVDSNGVAPERLMIDEHFQLYSDLEAGSPVQIPLFIRLYGGNHSTQTQASFLRYVQNSIGQVFSSPRVAQDVVSFEPSEHYDDLFAFADSQINTRLDHSMVFQVDEFWAEGRRSLLDLTGYWTGVTHRRPRSAPTTGPCVPPWDAERHADRRVDVFGNFQPHLNCYDTTRHDDPEQYDVPKRWVPTITKQQLNRGELRRCDFFWGKCGDDTDPHKESRIDRIPYLWDFGFMVADRRLWERNAREQLDDGIGMQFSVGDVWQSLCCGISKLPQWLDEEGKVRDYADGRETNWPDFFAAARRIGQREQVAAFDVDLSTSESLSCLLLEIWASTQAELMRPSGQAHWPPSWTGRDPSDPFGVSDACCGCRNTLRQMCDLYESALFVSLILLVTTCPHLQSSDRRVFRSHLSSRAAASREWYHTASAATSQDNADNLALLRLPGTFTVRGDWSLAAAAGSRSEMLAHHALDILSSRRVNLLRFQDGIGLPVRDIVPDAEIGNLVSAIRVFDTTMGQRRALHYDEIIQFGQAAAGPKLRWAFRSLIRGFDRDSFYWRRWIARMIEDSAEYWPYNQRNSANLNEVIHSASTHALGQHDRKSTIGSSYNGFRERLDVLRGALRS